jgi:hypothetical protein
MNKQPLTVTEMTDHIVETAETALLSQHYSKGLSMNVKEIMGLTQAIDFSASAVERSDIDPTTKRILSDVFVVLYGRMLGLNRLYVGLQNAAVLEQLK